MAARKRFAIGLLTSLCALGLVAPVSGNPLQRGGQNDALLSARQAFVPVSAVWRDGMVLISIRVEPGHYLYRHTLALEDPDGVLTLPEGEPYHDEFFGDVMIYRDWITASLALTHPPTAVTLSYQGCADVGVCYPPQTRVLPVTLARQ